MASRSFLISHRTTIALAVGAIVSAVFTYFAVRSIDLATFWDGLSESNYWWLLPAAGLMAAGVFVRAVRWRLLFPRGVRPPLTSTTRALLIGQFFNSIFPARAGEAARIIVLHREARTSRAQAAGTAIVERIYDVVGLLILLFLFLPLVPEIDWLRQAAIFGAAVVAVVVTGIAILVLFGVRAVRLLLRPVAYLPRVREEHVEAVSERLTLGLAALHRPSLALPAFALTICSWLIFAASFWALSVGFHLDLGYAGGMLVLVATSLVLVIPSLPGALGTFEAAAVVALRAYDIDDSEALAYAVVLHALNVVPYIVLGYVVLHGHVRRGVADPDSSLGETTR